MWGRTVGVLVVHKYHLLQYGQDKLGPSIPYIRNNILFGKKELVKKWDVLGIVVVYFITGGPIWSCMFGCFFVFHRRKISCIYSIATIPVESDVERITVIFLFLSIEMLSTYCAVNSVIACFCVICSYFLHSSYWMNLAKEEQCSASNYRKFQILHLHTSRFNEAFSNTFLASIKEIASVALVLSTSFLIRYQRQLELESFILLGGFGPGNFSCLVAIYLPVGWVWKSSVEFKRRLLKQESRENRRRNYLRPFGIMIGSFYVLKGHTFFSLTHILLRYIFRLLVAFKVNFDIVVYFWRR